MDFEGDCESENGGKCIRYGCQEHMFGKTEIRRKQFTERERNLESVRKEDFLIKQIDEFKEKAKQLQQLLDTKESRVQELQNVVEEREQKARSLQEILNERRQEADGITKGVESYGKQVAQKLEYQISELKEYLKEQEEGSSGKLEKLTASVNELRLSVEALQALANGLSGTMEDLPVSVEKIGTTVNGLPASVEKIGTTVNGLPTSVEKINASVDGLPAMIDGITSSIDSLSTSMEGIVTSMDGLSDTLENSVSRKWDEMFTKMDTMKGELSEKIHSENVKCYRNVQALVEELEQKMEQSEQEDAKPTGSFLKAAVVLGVVNLAALAGIAFYAFGLYYHLF